MNYKSLFAIRTPLREVLAERACAYAARDYYSPSKVPKSTARFPMTDTLRRLVEGVGVRVEIGPAPHDIPEFYSADDLDGLLPLGSDEPREPIIYLPGEEAYHAPDRARRILLHELVHATGRRKRFGGNDRLRDNIVQYGTAFRIVEEPTAEIGAQLLMEELFPEDAVNQRRDGAEYVASWHHNYAEKWVDAFIRQVRYRIGPTTSQPPPLKELRKVSIRQALEARDTLLSYL